MRKTCRVLVTGCGSGVGQGIIKSLRISGLPLTIVGADISPMNAALYRTDESCIIPKVEQKGSLEKIIKIVNDASVDVIMVGSEFDLKFFSENKGNIENNTKAIVIVAPVSTIEIADDKWLTTEFLIANQLPYATAYIPSTCDDAIFWAEKNGFPLILKTRKGTSSRHVHIIHSNRELAIHFNSVPMPMLQHLIDTPSSILTTEYTCSVFKAYDGSMVGPFIARRTVRGGTSWIIEVLPVPILESLLLDIARCIDFSGSLNVQLMLTAAGGVPFELNARFSGTTAVRAHFGFNEPQMALLSYFYREKLQEPVIRSGVAMRYHEEVFIDDVTAGGLFPNTQKGKINSWF